MAARVLLLGDLQRVLSVARRRYGYLLAPGRKRQAQVRLSALLCDLYERL